MTDSPVTRNELKAHIEPLARSMDTLAGAVTTIAEQSARLKNHATDIRDLRTTTAELVTHKTETRIYWKLFGAVGTILFAGIVNLMFFPS